MKGLLKIAIVAMALCAAAFPAGGAQPGTDRAFAAVRDAFEHIRSDYVDTVEDATVLRAAIKGMLDAFDLHLIDTADVWRPATPSDIPGLGDVDSAIDKIAIRGTIEPEQLAHAAIAGMLGALDRQSQYIDPKKWREIVPPPRSGGVGLNLAMDAGVVRVASAIEDGPADKAGVVAGDILVALDGAPIAGLALADVVAKLRGTLDSEIVLTLSRGRGKPIDITVVRAPVYQQSVYSGLKDGVGYLLLTRLSEQTPQNLKAAIGKIQAAAGSQRLRGYVIDLRDNSGGLLEVAVMVTRSFLESGLIATTTARGRETQRFEADAQDLTKAKPIVVLINERTAVGAEIIAGALQQQQHRAVIIGAPSAGAGTIQTIFPLGDGNGALRLTTSRVATASSHPLDGNGIVPDIAVTQSQAAVPGVTKPAQDLQLQSAMNFLRQGKRL
jgi:carboxyl-terminal processing protease